MQTNILIKLVIFSIINNNLSVFLQSKKLPEEKYVTHISLDENVKNIFKKSTNLSLKNQYIEQLYTLSIKKERPDEIGIVYYLLLSETEITEEIKNNWQAIKTNNIDAIDKQILNYAIQRLQWKIEYTNVIYSLLPNEFIFSKLQKAYEIILEKNLDKRNFRKKIMSLDFLKSTKKKKIDNSRPAQIFEFKKRTPVIIKIFS